MDDIFDEDDLDETNIAQQDWRNVTERRIKDGYREGISNGQEASLQDGFNEGFREHLNSSLSHGFMSGVLSGLLAMQDVHDIPNLTESEMTTLTDLLHRLQQLKVKQHEVANLHQISRTDLTSSSNSHGASVSERSTLDCLAGDLQTVTGDHRTPCKENIVHCKGDDSRNVNAGTVHDQGDIIQSDFTKILQKLDLQLLANYQPAASNVEIDCNLGRY